MSNKGKPNNVVWLPKRIKKDTEWYAGGRPPGGDPASKYSDFLLPIAIPTKKEKQIMANEDTHNPPPNALQNPVPHPVPPAVPPVPPVPTVTPPVPPAVPPVPQTSKKEPFDKDTLKTIGIVVTIALAALSLWGSNEYLRKGRSEEREFMQTPAGLEMARKEAEIARIYAEKGVIQAKTEQIAEMTALAKVSPKSVQGLSLSEVVDAPQAPNIEECKLRPRGQYTTLYSGDTCALKEYTGIVFFEWKDGTASGWTQKSCDGKELTFDPAVKGFEKEVAAAHLKKSFEDGCRSITIHVTKRYIELGLE